MKKKIKKSKIQKIMGNSEDFFKKYPYSSKAITYIVLFILSTSLIIDFSRNKIYNEGYEAGKQKEKETNNEIKYPLIINVEDQLGPFKVGDKLKIVIEVINPTNREIYVKGYNIFIPPQGWELDEHQLTITCESLLKKENIEIEDNTSLIKREITISSEAETLSPGQRKRIPNANPPIATEPGEYIFNYCIKYADGAQICPRSSLVVVQ